MAEIETRFAVFFGKVDQKRESGWYWTAYNGPFETKANAVEHVGYRSLREFFVRGAVSTLHGPR
jgi:hypothetical protein